MTRAAGGIIDVADLPSNDGWQDLPLQTDISGNVSFPPEYLRVDLGGLVIVYLRGRTESVNVMTTARALSQLPADCIPSNQSELGIVPYSSTGKGRLWVDSGGMLRGQTDGTAANNPIFLVGSFVASP